MGKKDNNLLMDLMTKSNALYSQIRALIMGVCLAWLLIKQDPIPVIIWLLISVLFNLIGILYWRQRAKKYSTRMKEIDLEIQKLNEQIKEKRENFQKMKDDYLSKP